MPKHSKGTATRTGPVILKTSEHNSMRKIRCPNCHSMAVPTTLHNGRSVMKCTGTCQAVFTSTRM